VTGRGLVPVVTNRDTRENVDDECDNAEDSREDHQCVHAFAEVDTERSDVGRVAENSKIEEQNGQFGRPDGEFVHDLGPPEPLLISAIEPNEPNESSYHESSSQLLIIESRHKSSVTIGSRFKEVREEVNDIAIILDVPRQATELSKIEKSLEKNVSGGLGSQERIDIPWQLR
jgi:hypothetical protein